MVETAADPRTARSHDHDPHVIIAGAGPALVAGHLEQVDGIEAVIAELNLGHRAAAGIGDAHRGADDAAFVQRRVPGRLESLRRREHPSERRAYIFAEDIRNAEMCLTVVQR